MKIPKRFKVNVFKNKGGKYKYWHYEYVKSYPNFIQYRCVETGALECFQRSYFVIQKTKEFFKNDNNSN